MWDVGLLSILILLTAFLYSSVGHAGASGYLAAMALCGVAPAAMRPSALVLNVLVASVATWQFVRAGCFTWSRFWPFALGSVPLAFVGGTVALPGRWYKVGVGVVLLLAAWRLWQSGRVDAAAHRGKPLPLSVPAALVCGGGIGLLSGLTGTGGGVFLSPLLLFTGWAQTRENAGVSAAFNLVNSVAGLTGLMTHVSALPGTLPFWAAAAVVGGAFGSGFGASRFEGATLRRLLAVVLVIAGLKMSLA